MSSAEFPIEPGRERTPYEDVAQSLVLVFQRLEFLASNRRREWVQSWGAVLDAEIARYNALDFAIAHHLGTQDISYELNDVEAATLRFMNTLKKPEKNLSYSQVNLQNLLTPEVREAGHSMIDVLLASGVEVEPIGPDGKYDSERTDSETDTAYDQWHEIYTRNIQGNLPDPNRDVE